jgi:hypothetical protein
LLNEQIKTYPTVKVNLKQLDWFIIIYPSNKQTESDSGELMMVGIEGQLENRMIKNAVYGIIIIKSDSDCPVI